MGNEIIKSDKLERTIEELDEDNLTQYVTEDLKVIYFLII
jgi:hypothetical protein